MQSPGFDMVLSLCQMSPLGDPGKQVRRTTFRYYFCNFLLVYNLFKVKSEKKKIVSRPLVTLSIKSKLCTKDHRPGPVQPGPRPSREPVPSLGVARPRPPSLGASRPPSTPLPQGLGRCCFLQLRFSHPKSWTGVNPTCPSHPD